MQRRWLLLGLLGALFGGGAESAPLETATSESPPAERRADAGHRAEGPRFYTWQEDPEDAASWRAALEPLDRE
ncbi:MAG TPA: hypothetical protein VHQ66_00395 [Myxococcota bacterium]|nr:hypothetical protein [Myxococcota bacterium]